MNYPKVEKTIELIQELVSIPSPTGFAFNAINYIEDKLKKLQVTYFKNNKGGIVATLEGKNNDVSRMLTAHVDTLGAMVKDIKSSGRLTIDLIGGFRYNSIEGEYCTVHTASGKTYTGTILMHQTSVHVYKDAGSAERNQTNMEIRLDEVTISATQTRELGIEVGDFVSFDPRVQVTPSGFIKSRHLDDKASVAILLNLIETIKENNIELPHTIHILFSNNEEIGYGGNSNIPETVVEYLAVDMGAIGDGQATDEYTVSICAKDSSGPYHYLFRQELIRLAKENNINYKVDIYPYYGSDASAAIKAGVDIVHGLIGPGIDSSHAFERTHQSSLEETTKLLAHYVTSPIVTK